MRVDPRFRATTMLMWSTTSYAVAGIRNAHNVIQAQIKSMGAQVSLAVHTTITVCPVQFAWSGFMYKEEVLPLARAGQYLLKLVYHDITI